MAEGSLDYTRDNFPIFGVLEDLTESLNDSIAEPTEALVRYNNLYTKQLGRRRGGERYASTSVTSGGHARRPGLNIKEIIAANTNTARQTLGELAIKGAVNKNAVINPVDLGYIKGWSQVEFMKFWLGIIGGLDLGKRGGNQKARLYERSLANSLKRRQVNLQVMTDSAKEATERAPEYFRFALAHADTTEELMGRLDLSPVNDVLSLVDPDLSLGSQTERIFARMRGIPTFKVAPVMPGTLEASISPALQQDLDKIIRFGATVCTLAEGPMFGLVEQANDDDLLVASVGRAQA